MVASSWLCLALVVALSAAGFCTDFTQDALIPRKALPVEGEVPRSEGTARSLDTATQALSKAFTECIEVGTLSCIKPRILSFLSVASRSDEVRITRDLSIVRKTGAAPVADYLAHADDSESLLDRVDEFLVSHELAMRMPKELLTGEALPFVPRFLIKNLPFQLTVPLTTAPQQAQERGFMKKVVLPFLLGLKFNATALIPLALAVIALKTWKALTLGLLSMVLSGAMVIFKFTKPKVVNYEVVHYPHHTAPVVEHAYEHHHGYGRVLGQPLAYAAH